MPNIYLARHGETAWSRSGQHTGLSDLPLTEDGERNAVNLGKRLAGLSYQRVFTSPLQRARRTCELAGLAAHAIVDPDLVEWNYGDYEGRTTAEIQREAPHWNVFRDGCPGGESPQDVLGRAQRIVAMLRSKPGNAVLFSSGHFLRVLGAAWLGLSAEAGRYWTLGTTSLSVLGYEHDASEPVIKLWNEVAHVT